jgi:hypothetical protein
MSNNGRILYLTHDSHAPSGGVKTIYFHVSHLVKNGYSAFVVHNQTGFKLPWLVFNVPILYADKDFKISTNDIVVIPEDYRAALEALRNINIRKYIFCQNHFYIFKGLQKDNTWADLGISDVFCSSEIISKFLQSTFDYEEVPVIHCAINLELFKQRKKKLQIAYMPRKRPSELDFIRNLFNRLYKQYKDVPWICIDKVNEVKVAEILSESAIFLSTSLYEGFGLPPIEAMACGCIVVGFHGGGGLEYASSENGYWCEEGNIIECVRTLGHVVSIIDNNDKEANKIRNQALKKADEYTFERQEKELINFWSKIYK